jgi:membrane protein
MARDSAPTSVFLLTLAAAGLLLAGKGQSRPATAHARSSRPGGQARPDPGAAKRAMGSSGAGRHAATPAQIPGRGWLDVLKRVYAGFNDDRIMTEAAGMTFYSLLALFPALATLVSLYGLVSDPRTVGDQLQALGGVLPGGAMDIIEQQVKALTSNGAQSLSFAFVIGLLTSLWSSNQAIKGLFDALNVVYHEKEKRGYFGRTLLTLGFTLSGIVFLVLSMTSIVVVPIVLKFFGLGDSATALLALARWPVLLVVLGLFLAFVYRYGPSREHARWQWVSWGSAFASITWLLASLGFSYYVANFGSYNKTYGSLGAAVGFMTWIWISSMIVLLGGELNAELEQQTEKDTTTGAPLPIGMRGAYKADTKA